MRRPCRKSWERLFYIKTKVHVQNDIASLVSGDVASLFHEIPRTIQQFLPALHELDCAAALEVRFSTSQAFAQGLLGCLIFIMLAPYMVF
jgi:hypothetical protein